SRVPAVIRAASQIDSESTVDDGSKTKLISVTGDVQRPGLVEVSYGTTLREVVFGMAGGPRKGTDLKAVLAGGPSGSLVPPSQFNRSLAPDEREVFLGSGNLVALDRSRSLIDVVRGLTWFNARESCGKCTPCREGARRLAEHLDQVDSIESLQSSRDDLIELSEIVKDASLCGLGKMAPAPLLSALQSFAPDQVFEGQQ
ncbi:MAG: NADH-ubiquinone oxidoreductase-F iron-sulfur binding region domain-containing protein, partial [Chloroflexota bacterium]